MTISPNAWRTRKRTLREIMHDVIDRWEHPHADAVPLIYTLRDMPHIADAQDAVRQFLDTTDEWDGPFADKLINELRAQLDPA